MLADFLKEGETSLLNVWCMIESNGQDGDALVRKRSVNKVKKGITLLELELKSRNTCDGTEISEGFCY